MERLLMVLGVLGISTAATLAGAPPTQTESEFAALCDAYLTRFKPLWMESSAAWWEANITGADAAYARKKAADKALVDLHSDRAVFARLKALREGGQVTDALLRRELDVMYRAFLPGQADPQLQKRIVDLANDVEQIFNTHRSRVGDRLLTENDVREILAKTTDSAEVAAAWKGYMEVGGKVEAKLHELVGLRNELARQLGLDNFYTLQLTIGELDETTLFQLFDELDALTRESFTRLKSEIDAERAARFHVAAAELRPWHYGDLFFQETVGGQEVDLDGVYKNADLLALTRKYYSSIGLPADDILARSDLYEKPGKCPHAFCTSLDRAQDIRVLANLRPNLLWADTILHETGHGVYDKFVRPDVPFLLHEASHAITTEGMAEMFGAMSKNEEWLTRVRGVDAAEAARVGRAAHEALRREKLIFSRWAQVMVRFEHGMYTNPDQNLNKLWWDLKKQCQLLNPPETVDRPDYAAKIHLLTDPVYYQSYMMGELFAAQVRQYIATEVLHLKDPGGTSFYERPEAGQYLREKVFGPGNLYSWNELTERATGQPLTAKAFAAEFVK